MFYPLPKYVDKTWADYIFIMPAVAVGNVAQLAVDLLLATLQVELIGRMHTPNILPMVGADPFETDSKNLTTSCQVYVCTKHKLVIMQQRTSVIANGRQQYREQLMEWIQKQNFKYTILLSSCSNNFLTGFEQSDKLNFLCTPDMESSVGLQLRTQMGWKLMKKRTVFTLVENSDEGIHHMPGSGITKSLFQEFMKRQTPLVLVVWYCSEGDNVPDAVGLVEHLNSWLHVVQKDKQELDKNIWKIPISWNLLFGNQPPSSIY